MISIDSAHPFAAFAEGWEVKKTIYRRSFVSPVAAGSLRMTMHEKKG